MFKGATWLAFDVGAVRTLHCREWGGSPMLADCTTSDAVLESVRSSQTISIGVLVSSHSVVCHGVLSGPKA